MALILHIPHASKHIPKEYLPYFCLSEELLEYELLKMTDHYTDELFSTPSDSTHFLKFPVSRLLVDPERFEDDHKELMSEVGMGCIYLKTHDGHDLKNVDPIRSELLTKYYRRHHDNFTQMVGKIYKEHSKVLIVDCHSFPKNPLPYEKDQRPNRAEFCIGTDIFHTPAEIRDFLMNFFRKSGFSVALDKPFSGSIVPMEFWKKDKNIKSVMIEVRRDLYMNEESGEKSPNFERIKEVIASALKGIKEITV